jgi:WD40 repeat protein
LAVACGEVGIQIRDLTAEASSITSIEAPYVESLAFDADGSRLVGVTDSGHVRGWDVVDGRELFEFVSAGGEASFLGDGSLVLVVAADEGEESAMLIDVESGAQVARFDTSTADTFDEWPDNGEPLAIRPSFRSDRIDLIDLWSGGIIQHFMRQSEKSGILGSDRVLQSETGVALHWEETETHAIADASAGFADPIKFVARDRWSGLWFADQGRLVVANKGDGSYRVAEIGEGRLLLDTARTCNSGVLEACQPSGSLALLSNEPHGRPVLADLRSGRTVAALGELSVGMTEGRFSRDGRQLFTVHRRGAVVVWDVASAQPSRELRCKRNGSLGATMHVSDGGRVLIAGDHWLRVWGPEGGGHRALHTSIPANWVGRVGKINAGGTTMCVIYTSPSPKPGYPADVTQIVELLDCGLGRSLACLEEPDLLYGDAVLGEDGKSLVMLRDGRCTILDCGTLLTRTIEVDSDGKARASLLAVDARGERAATLEVDNLVRVWSLRGNGAELDRLQLHENPCAALFESGSLMPGVSGDDPLRTTVQYWVTRDGSSLALVNHGVNHYWPPRTAFVGGRSGRCVSWARESGGIVVVHASGPGNRTFWFDVGATNVESIDMSADGRRLVVAHSAGPVQIRDAETGELLARLLNPGFEMLDPFVHAMFIADDRMVVGTTRSGQVVRWSSVRRPDQLALEEAWRRDIGIRRARLESHLADSGTLDQFFEVIGYEAGTTVDEDDLQWRALLEIAGNAHRGWAEQSRLIVRARLLRRLLGQIPPADDWDIGGANQTKIRGFDWKDFVGRSSDQLDLNAYNLLKWSKEPLEGGSSADDESCARLALLCAKAAVEADPRYRYRYAEALLACGHVTRAIDEMYRAGAECAEGDEVDYLEARRAFMLELDGLYDFAAGQPHVKEVAAELDRVRELLGALEADHAVRLWSIKLRSQ